MDGNWLTFATTCRDEMFSACAFQEQLIAECGGHADIAWAVFYAAGADSLNWLHRRVPALDMRCPAELVR